LLAMLTQLDVAKGWLFVVPRGSRARYGVMAILFGNKLYWFASQCQHV